MRVLTSLAVLLVGALAGAQTWEKLLAPGLSYRTEIQLSVPRVIHALRYTPKAPGLSLRSEVAHRQVFGGGGQGARQEISALAKQAGAIGGVNGDFFGTSGEALGVVVRDGELISRPFTGRAGFAWGPDTSSVVLLSWTASIFFDGPGRKPLNGINEDVPENGMVLFTNTAAEARCPVPNTLYVVKVDESKFAPTSLVRGEVVQVLKDRPALRVPEGTAVIAVRGNAASSISAVKAGTNVAVTMQTDGADWSKVDNVVGGGPRLVRAGKVSLDIETAGFSKSFSETRHPRTAIGRTAEGDIWMVVIDGRQPMSAGASLAETAQVMLNLGCTEAINLDGGGSSTLSVYGEVLNRPSDGRERKVANGVLVFGPKQPETGGTFAIQGPARINPGSTVPYQLIGPDGKPVPDREVLWSAMGDGGWVDPSGNARALKDGIIKVRAYCRGVVATLEIRVGTE